MTRVTQRPFATPNDSAPPGARSGSRAPRATAGLVDVAIIALAASLVGIGNQLAHDDIHLIQQNARVQDLTALRDIFARPYWPPPFSEDLYRPLTTLLMALQYAVGNGDALVFRVLSYLLYAASAVAVLGFARRFTAHGPALAAAALFAAHPVHVEAVALAVAQSELVVAILAVAMTTLYVRWRRDGLPATRQWGILALLYAAASLFKEHALVIPGLLMAAELTLVRRPPPSWRPLAGGFATLLLAGLAVLALRTAVLGDVRGSFVAEALADASTSQRLLTVLRVVPEWVRLLLWPAHLRLDYSPQEFVASTSFGGWEALGAGMVIALAILAWQTRARAPMVPFGIAWMAIAIFPVSNILVPTGILIAERTLFLPSVGLSFAIAGGVHALAPLVTAQAARRAAVAGCVVLVVAGVVRSAERHRVWRHDGFLAVRTASDAPRSFRAQRAYADVLFEIRQPEAAREAYDRALRYAPPSLRWRVHNDYARQLRSRDERSAEIEQLRASLAQRPDQEDARGYLVAALLTQGMYREAEAQADTALARGAPNAVFGGLKILADSARRASAPPGSVRIAITAASGSEPAYR